jgi:hypothetical protein
MADWKRGIEMRSERFNFATTSKTFVDFLRVPLPPGSLIVRAQISFEKLEGSPVMRFVCRDGELSRETHFVPSIDAEYSIDLRAHGYRVDVGQCAQGEHAFVLGTFAVAYVAPEPSAVDLLARLVDRE